MGLVSGECWRITVTEAPLTSLKDIKTSTSDIGQEAYHLS